MDAPDGRSILRTLRADFATSLAADCCDGSAAGFFDISTANASMASTRPKALSASTRQWCVALFIWGKSRVLTFGNAISNAIHEPQPVRSARMARRWGGTILQSPRIIAMALHWFSPPIYVSTGKLGERYAVSNIERAADFLLSWRDRGMGPDWKIAVQACMAALKSEGGTEEARSAFAGAAKECGKLC